MANTTAIRAGRAFVELFADDTKLVRGLRAAERKLRVFGDGIRTLGLKMMSLGTALLAPLVGSTKVFSTLGDSVAKMAKRTGLSVETLSELGYAASQSGIDAGALENGLRRMQRSIYDAGRGLSTAVDALSDLGLSYRDLKNLSPEEQFKRIADRISQINDPTLKAAIAMSLLGRSGTALLPLFKQGAAGINALQDQARSLGLTMSGEDAAAAEVFGDTLDRLWSVVKMTTFQVGAALAPALQRMVTVITEVLVKINAWIQENRSVIVSIAKVIASVLAAGAVLVVLGTTISGLGLALGKLAGIITTVGAVFKGLGAAIAFLTQPVVLVIAAVAALGAYLIYASGAGAKALEWLGQRFALLKADALDAYQGVADALAAGDIALAARILWLTLKMEWTRGVNFLEKIWMNFRNVFVRLAYDAFDGAMAAATTVWHALEVGWIETTAFLSKTWNGFSSFFARTWETMKAIAAKSALQIMKLFDDSINLEAAYSIVDDEKNKALDTINQDQKAQQDEIERRRKSRRDDAGTMRDAMMEEIAKQNTDRHKALDDAYLQRMQQNADDLDIARKAWRDSLNEARRKRTVNNRPDRMQHPGTLKEPDLSGLGSLFDAAAAKLTTAGGFSGFGRFGAEGGSAADRTANATEQIAKTTRQMLNLQRDQEEMAV